MKVLVLGWMRMRGTGRESKKPYDFARLHIANPVSEKVGEQSSRTGEGFEQGHLDLQLGCEGHFRGIKYPAMLELKIDHQLGPTGKVEPVCVGCSSPAALKAAG